MSTETIEQPAAETVDPVWQATLDEIEREIAETDPGQLAQNDDERELHRILRFRARVVAERTRVAEQTEAMLRELDNRIKGIDYRYTALLEAITKRLLPKGKKSVKTPYGTCGFRATAAGIVVVDEKKLPPEFWTTPEPRPVIDKAKINECFKQSGEVIDGCDVKPAGENFYVK